MTTTEISEVFAPEEYFAELIGLLRANGMDKLARCEVAFPGWCKTPCRACRATSLFFQEAGRALIIKAEFVEILSPISCYEHWWSVSVDAAADPVLYTRWLKDEFGIKMSDRSWDLDTHSFYSQAGSPNKSVMREYGGECGEFNINRRYAIAEDGWRLGKDRISPLAVAACINGIVWSIRPVLAEMFKELQVTHLPPQEFPSYAWFFWRQFPLRRLQSKVRGRVWGSDFPQPAGQ
ncbi:MAG: hypothetical protein WCT32_04940 [Patescibacteria group bacterium]|jgi:hypothetical protein